MKKVTTGATTIFVYSFSGQLVAEYQLSSQWDIGGTNYLTEDNLGTPRIITKIDSLGTLTVNGRHDYLPFGEDIASGLGGRSGVPGYASTDGLRQKFTQKERDNETGLDYFLARYYASTQGRFSSVDPYGPWAMSEEDKFAFMVVPQQWNRYTYSLNNPLKYVDPTGLEVYDSNVDEEARKNIHNALVGISKSGNKHDRAVANFILKNDVLVGLSGGDNATGLQDKAATNQRIAQGWVSTGEAASYIRININSSIAHPNSPERSANLEGTLVHEGNHAFDDARTISSLSAGQGMNVVWDPTQHKTENDAYHREANYLLRRGGTYQTVGLDTNGAINGYGMGLLTNENGKIKVNEAKIQDTIRTTYGVTRDRPGPTTTQQYGLRPPR